MSRSFRTACRKATATTVGENERCRHCDDPCVAKQGLTPLMLLLTGFRDAIEFDLQVQSMSSIAQSRAVEMYSDCS